MPIPVNTRVSLSLHPDNVTALDGYDETTAPFLGGTVAAFTTAYQGIGSMWEARDTVSQNGAWNEDRRIVELSKLSARRFDVIAKSVDGAMTNLRKNIATFEAELSTTVSAKSNAGLSATAVAAEIRHHVKDMAPSERIDFIQRSLKDGDETTLSAVLSGPSYLSGISADEKKLYTTQMHEQFKPDTAKRLKACRAAEKLIMERSGLIFEGLEKAVGASPQQAAALRTRHDAATKALA